MAISRKTKSLAFEVENYFKIMKLYLGQPSKLDEMACNFLQLYLKHYGEDDKFSLFAYLAHLYDTCGMQRKANYHYYMAASMYHNHKPELALILLHQIQ